CFFLFFFFSSRRRHTRSYGDWSSDVCSSDLAGDHPFSARTRTPASPARPPRGPGADPTRRRLIPCDSAAHGGIRRYRASQVASSRASIRGCTRASGRATADVTLEYMGRHASRESNATLDHLGDFTTTRRVLPISGLAAAIGVFAALVAAALLKLIGLFTNLFFF